jgi:hypothetical protein
VKAPAGIHPRQPFLFVRLNMREARDLMESCWRASIARAASRAAWPRRFPVMTGSLTVSARRVCTRRGCACERATLPDPARNVN